MKARNLNGTRYHGALRSVVVTVLAVSLAAACTSGSAHPADPTTKSAPTTTIEPGKPPSNEWKVVFDDEFNGARLNANHWATCYWFAAPTCTNTTTKELELYQPANVGQSKGKLTLTAKKQTAIGTVANGQEHQFAYTSGIVSGASPTSTLFDFEYGFVDARAKVPPGQGLWSAFWMLPVDRNSLPEIDVFEVFGQKPAVDNTTVHWNAGGQAQQLGHQTKTPDLSAGWHDYSLQWDPTKIVWYLDGREIWQVTQSASIPHTEMYLLADLAVGGSFGGPPAPQTPFPSSLLFDYVRVWQHR